MFSYIFNNDVPVLRLSIEVFLMSAVKWPTTPTLYAMLHIILFHYFLKQNNAKLSWTLQLPSCILVGHYDIQNKYISQHCVVIVSIFSFYAPSAATAYARQTNAMSDGFVVSSIIRCLSYTTPAQTSKRCVVPVLQIILFQFRRVRLILGNMWEISLCAQ